MSLMQLCPHAGSPAENLFDPALIASLLALGAGPALVGPLRRRPEIHRAVDVGVGVTMAVVLLGELLPHSYAMVGDRALLAAAAGLVLAVAGERVVGRLFGRALAGGERPFSERPILALVAVLAMLLHALVDGIALAVGHEHEHHELAWAVVLHRVPASLALWWVARARGPALAWTVLVGLAVGTVLGYHGALSVLPRVHLEWLFALQALLVGVLLHALVHGPLASLWRWMTPALIPLGLAGAAVHGFAAGHPLFGCALATLLTLGLGIPAARQWQRSRVASRGW